MITLTYSQLNDKRLAQAFAKLLGMRTTVGIGLRIKYLCKAVKDTQDGLFKEFREQVLPKFALEGADLDPNSFQLPEGREEEYLKANAEFGNKTATIPLKKLLVAELDTTRELTPMDLIMLEPFIEEPTPVPVASPPKKGPGVPLHAV